MDEAFKTLLQRPQFAWPTLALLVGCWLAFGLSTALGVSGYWWWGWSVACNALAAYLVFTVGHDASHGSVSRVRWLNDTAGLFSTLLLSPIPFFRLFRYVHMQHHRHVNEPGADPDHYCGTGPRWQLPLRWATLDLHYLYLYFQPACFTKRSVADQRAIVLAMGFAFLVFIGFLLSPWFAEYLLFFILPSRIAVFLLALCFDFLPHYPHTVKASEAPYQATANRLGADWLLCPLLTMQNYHLSHHLYPSVPFYRYRKAWLAREAFHESQLPATQTPLGLRPLQRGMAEAQ
ncbi:fatty acid desaturase [Simiduia agarivorans]|uniref:Fatty acid desaturase n=1 Tax=Simiduia agarivorans (strain DSM 21679 / JCM 13881 / BCRC 17597 / SA1) TaxID=1117647 RepID=K4KP70_SIMAS|nr:fatty acid desaturase [Simiduia agarivorans]AFV00036.1 fatty acid desaturase [Simiduia agarivorans SA1 = DSM 21679]